MMKEGHRQQCAVNSLEPSRSSCGVFVGSPRYGLNRRAEANGDVEYTTACKWLMTYAKEQCR